MLLQERALFPVFYSDFPDYTGNENLKEETVFYKHHPQCLNRVNYIGLSRSQFYHTVLILKAVSHATKQFVSLTSTEQDLPNQNASYYFQSPLEFFRTFQELAFMDCNPELQAEALPQLAT